MSHSSHLSLCLPDGAARIICYNFYYHLKPRQQNSNPRQSVEVHQAGTVERCSTDWATEPRQECYLDIFPPSEFVLDSTMANAAGFQHLGGAVVTVLSSKTSQRYRLQVRLEVVTFEFKSFCIKKTSRVLLSHFQCWNFVKLRRPEL